MKIIRSGYFSKKRVQTLNKLNFSDQKAGIRQILTFQVTNFKNMNFNRVVLQQFANTISMRNEIISLIVQNGLEDDCYVEMLDYTIELFESQSLGTDYYGYHNINHELEVTYISLLAATQNKIQFTEEDIKYLYVAALFHDFDPQKNVDKPHEESVLKFISMDRKLRQLISVADIDLEIIKVMILRTTYPWSGGN